MDRYKAKLEQDRVVMASTANKPASRAYQSLNLAGNSEMIAEETKVAKKVYQADKGAK